MSITIRELFYGAYREVQLIENEQDQLGPDQEEECRQVYNRWTDQLRANGTTVYHIERTLFPLTAGIGAYTIGPGGTWNTVWPERLERASLILADGTEYALWPLTDDEWQLWVNKAQTSSQPRRFHYEKDFPLGIFHMLYVPSAAIQVALYLEEQPLVPITRAAGPAYDYSAVQFEYPPSYQALVEFGLALQVGGRNPRAKISNDLRQRAKEAMDLIVNANNRPLARSTGLFSSSGNGRSDVMSGNRWGW